MEKMEKKSLGRGLDDISDVFLSTRKNKKIPQGNAGHGFVVNKSFSDNTEPRCEIEEHVIVRKNIAYPDTLNSQQYVLRLFSKYLEEKYLIKSIELRKTDRKSRPGIKKLREEKIIIFIHGKDK
jgi:hypothetical protein